MYIIRYVHIIQYETFVRIIYISVHKDIQYASFTYIIYYYISGAAAAAAVAPAAAAQTQTTGGGAGPRAR